MAGGEGEVAGVASRSMRAVTEQPLSAGLVLSSDPCDAPRSWEKGQECHHFTQKAPGLTVTQLSLAEPG